MSLVIPYLALVFLIWLLFIKQVKLCELGQSPSPLFDFVVLVVVVVFLFVMMQLFNLYIIFQSVNLSYQDLGHPYQKKEFQRVLRRLIRCEHIQLIENSLQDLSTVLLPRCTHLYLQRNFITELKVSCYHVNCSSL